MPGPLEGLRILDLSRMTPGGYCTMLLGELGADVVKVEDCGAGDYVRFAGPLVAGADPTAASSFFIALNRGKRSLQLDLKAPAGRDAFLRLVADYDVLVESFRPGVMDRLGVGYETLASVHPGLVYCAITGYGQTGPNRLRAGHDLNYVALSGLLGLMGPSGEKPQIPSVQIADVAGGSLMAAVGILAAMHERERSGLGQYIDIGMTDGTLSLLAPFASRELTSDVPLGPQAMELAGSLACYNVYACRDGFVTLGALERKFWDAFCEGAGLEALKPQHLAAADSETGRAVAARFAAATRAEWATFSERHDCCMEPVATLAEALASPGYRERGMIAAVPQAGAGTIEQLAHPIKLGRTPARAPGEAPALGADTREIFREAGFTPEDLTALESAGAIRTGGPDAARPKEQHFAF